MTDYLTIVEPLTPAELTNISTQALRAELARTLTISAQTLMRLALIWRELERRGEDLSDLRTGLAGYLPLIAAGQLDAEVVVRFAGNKTLLQSVSRLPVDEQHRLATGGQVDVLTFDEHGNPIATPLPVHALTATQARLVFDDGRLRPRDEQLALLNAKRLSKSGNAGGKRRVSIDRERRTIRIGRVHVALGDVFAALAELNPETDVGAERDKSVPIKLTEAEHKRLRIAAAEASTPADRLIRQALRTAGLI